MNILSSSICFGDGGLQARNPIPLKIRCILGVLSAKSLVGAKRHPIGGVWKFGEGMRAHLSSSSSDRSSKLRGPSQNSPRVASKRDINITKLNLTLIRIIPPIYGLV
ncbi:hypothetical protein AVEN_91509-1 [Araneus ventricosus]|uniref:Uncharacterized protein n=1 Tax=Araneus ventricosus TaxID=182803 RepID=A0A4Y2BJN1_ARAVE|nr:hypothetical protein AVEN_91509-1 [Araneus ventricosus]